MSPKYTKRSYESIAEAIAKSDSIDEVISRMSQLFAEDNPRFDEIKFREACIRRIQWEMEKRK